MNRRLSLIIAGVLAILAVILVKFYLDQQRQAIKSAEEQRLAEIQQNQVSILIAKNDISPGETLDPSMIDIVVAPANQVPPQTATNYGQITNKEAVAPIARGEPIILSKLASSRRAAAVARAGSLARTTPVGKRAITIPVDNISSLGGMIKPGDSVDVLCLLSVPIEDAAGKKQKKEVILPLFQNVLVLAVGTELAEEEEIRYAQEKDKAQKQAPAKIMTLALSPEEASLIAFTQEQGKIQLVLRSPGDTQIQPVQPATWETIFKYFMPERITKEEGPFEPAGPIGEVEIYRGPNREVVPLNP